MFRVSCSVIWLTSWHLNIWKVKIWLSQDWKELSKWSKKRFSLLPRYSPLDLRNKLGKMYLWKIKEKRACKSEEKCNRQNRKSESWSQNFHSSNYNWPAHHQNDDNEEYRKRSCLKIHGVECSYDERNGDVLEKVKECYEDIDWYWSFP